MFTFARFLIQLLCLRTYKCTSLSIHLYVLLMKYISLAGDILVVTGDGWTRCDNIIVSWLSPLSVYSCETPPPLVYRNGLLLTPPRRFWIAINQRRDYHHFSCDSSNGNHGKLMKLVDKVKGMDHKGRELGQGRIEKEL